MSQRQSDSATKRRSPLDRAILLSIAAMAAMNIIVLAQQLSTVPQLAASTLAGLGLA